MSTYIPGLMIVVAVAVALGFAVYDSRDGLLAWWHRATSAVAVEVVRHRTRHGRHTETRAEKNRLDDRWAIQLHDIAADLDPLPVQVGSYRDPLREHIDAAWAATGTTQAEYWRRTAPALDLPGPVPNGGMASSGSTRQAGEPRTPNQAMNLWRANDVIPPRIAAVLHRATSDDTAVEVNHATLEPYIVGLAGGDPFDGLGQDAWLDRLFAGAR